MTAPTKQLPYPPPWQDMVTLCAHICASQSTVENWVKQGILPPPRKRGGKLMWKWSEVDQYLNGEDADTGSDVEAERIRNGTRRALEAH
jgi:predicted DNA-binding transcriptional regulator AlpA